MRQADGVQVSVVIPVRDECDCILPLLQETVGVMRPLCRFEIIVVDDGSRDGTAAVLEAALERVPELLVVRHLANAGQSVALLSGVRQARARWIATLDGDGQNDPADLPRLLAAQQAATPSVRLFTGHRVRRQDSLGKRLGSRLANAVRRRLLGDATPDTGCGTKLFDRDAFLALPRFAHMHRFLPALFRRDGWDVATLMVNHRPRTAGRSKYGNLQRLAVGVFDLAGVCWLACRPVRCEATVLAPRTAATAVQDKAA